jgi:small-conductance mechanosensitive channel
MELFDQIGLTTLTERSFLDNSALTWITAAVATVLLATVLFIVRRLLRTRLERLAERTSTMVDDMIVGIIAATRTFFIIILSAYTASLMLELPDVARRATWVIAVLVLTAQAALWANRAVTIWLERYVSTRRETDPGSASTVQGLSFLIRLAIWSAALILAVDNLGYDVTALVAGLGVGGIAIALAVQNILGDLFASLSIVLDKPFVIGDFIIVGDMLGTVEHVGLKTTRVRSLSGEQLIFSNSDLLSSRIRNYKRMIERRVVFSFGVIYQTPIAQLERLPRRLREIIESVDKTRFDRAHLKQFGASSFDFEVVYYVLAADYNLYMDVQQEINLAICRAFEAEGISFAYPSRTIFMHQEDHSSAGEARPAETAA